MVNDLNFRLRNRLLSLVAAWVLVSAAGCGPPVEPLGDASPTPVVAAPTATPAPVPVSLEQLLLPTGTGLGITEPTSYGDSYANDPEWVNLFGRPHIRLTRQRVSLQGNQGTVSFIEFAGADEAREAAQHAAQTPIENRPLKAGQYDRFVVVIEVVQGDLEMFAREIRSLLENR